MGILGDLFPEHERQKYIGRHLEPGQVLFLFCKFTNPQKEKYLVVACTGKRPLLFVINSRIHPFIEKQPVLLKCQVKLSASDYDFLDHDSFVDCSKVIDDSTEKRSFAPHRWGKECEQVSIAVVPSLDSTIFRAKVGRCPYWIH